MPMTVKTIMNHMEKEKVILQTYKNAINSATDTLVTKDQLLANSINNTITDKSTIMYDMVHLSLNSVIMSLYSIILP